MLLKIVRGDCMLGMRQESVNVFTFSEDLWDFGVTGAEGAVNLKAISIIQE